MDELEMSELEMRRIRNEYSVIRSNSNSSGSSSSNSSSKKLGWNQERI